ncbi:hypothetical protein [Pseudanabaena sp. Chao 1811]|uniref:hypothetical protein n=1 Tax=Pseudanabaena sp. Chao 1811 TaxID=2963092 RepID=UPI0022F3DD35|nr:hypothetical protein [Pseudanabaena sp. Chao 1811]
MTKQKSKSSVVLGFSRCFGINGEIGYSDRQVTKINLLRNWRGINDHFDVSGCGSFPSAIAK